MTRNAYNIKGVLGLPVRSDYPSSPAEGALILHTTDGAQVYLNGAWTRIGPNGPSRSTDNAVAVYDGTTGQVVQNSNIYTTDASRSFATTDVNTGTNYITVSVHGLENGTAVTFSSSGTLPDPLSSAATYYIINKTTSTFQVSTSHGGSAVDIIDTGTGTHTIAVPIANLSIFNAITQPTNTATGIRSIATGYNNSAAANYSVILGGINCSNVADNIQSAIVGGEDNDISGAGANAKNQFIGGGRVNKITGAHNGAAIVGGSTNTISSGYYAFIGGGENNIVAGTNAAVVGGGTNTAYRDRAVIIGGNNNTIPTAPAAGTNAVILGGLYNSAGGASSVITGQYNTGTLNSTGSLMFGRGGYCDESYTLIFANSDTATSSAASNNQFVVDGKYSNVIIGRYVDQASYTVFGNSPQNQLRLHTVNANNQSKYIAHRADTSLSVTATYTWPTAPASSMFLRSDSSGNLSFKAIATDVNVVSNANYVITDTDGYNMILASATSANRTITLPSAANNTGRKIIIKRSDSTAAYYVAVSGTIEGATVHRLKTQYASLEVVSDGTSWYFSEPHFEYVDVNIAKSGGYDGVEENVDLGDSDTSYPLRFIGHRVGRVFTLAVKANFDMTTTSIDGFDQISVPLADLPFLTGYTADYIEGTFWTNANGDSGAGYRTVGGFFSTDSTNLIFNFAGDFYTAGNRVLSGTLIIKV